MKKYRRYIITTAVGAAIAVLTMLLGNIQKAENAAAVFRIISDGLFTAGVVLCGFGLLVFSGNSGTFDGLAYGVGKVFQLFRSDYEKLRKTQKTYYEYVKEKHEKKAPFRFLLITGAVYLVLAAAFMLLFFICYVPD